MRRGGSALAVYEGGRGRPSADLAFERWLLERAGDGSCGLVLYSWPRPVVVLGYSQKADDVDLGWCRAHGVPVLRRLTGGTGVAHHGDLAVSLALPRNHPWAASVVGLYRIFLDVVAPALRSLGGSVRRPQEERHASRVRSPICFEDQLADTLLVDGRKAVGCAQTRRSGGVLIHAAVLLGVDTELYARAFAVAGERVAAHLAPAVPNADWRAVGRSVAAALATALDREPDRRPLPDLPERFLEPYAEERWAPVPDEALGS